jgi:hypothetical protein
MEWPQTYFEMMYKIIREQNIALLKEISMIENISYDELMRDHLPSKKYLKHFIVRCQDQN